jgi:hypothetical protein
MSSGEVDCWEEIVVSDSPTLTDPQHIEVGRMDSNSSSSQLNDQRDYVITLPKRADIEDSSEFRPAPIYILGGRNIVLIGGHIRIDECQITNCRASHGDLFQRAVYIKDGAAAVKRDVYIEGLLIDADPGWLASCDADALTEDTQNTDEACGFDGIVINAPKARVTLQNVKVDDVFGTAAGFHGDAMQVFDFYAGAAYKGVRRLQTHNLTIYTNYQGLTTFDLGPALYKNTNIRYTNRETRNDSGDLLETYVILDSRGDDKVDRYDAEEGICYMGRAHYYRGVWVEPRYDPSPPVGEEGEDKVSESIRPELGVTDCGAEDRQSGAVKWAVWQAVGRSSDPDDRKAIGKVFEGVPGGGDFVALSEAEFETYVESEAD